MGQFKDINTIIRQLVDDNNVHPSMREALRNATQPTVIQPFSKVYLLMCDGDVTDVFTNKDMAMHDLYMCIKADEEEGLPHEWRVVVRQLNTDTLP